MQERLQKILSARGIASRRKAEEYILAGLVTVNGKKAILGQKADPEVDTIEVDGKVMSDRAEMLYYVMYKPVGIETSNVPHDVPKAPSEAVKGHRGGKPSRRPPVQTAPNVRDLLPPNLQGKLYPVGRLDKDSEGLLILTNDGPLAYRLTHPKFDHEKEYEVQTKDAIHDSSLAKIRGGLMIDGAKTKPAKIERTAANAFRISITEGRNRQIRRMCSKVGSEVVKLKRIRITTLTDSSLKPGKLRPLTNGEKTQLLASIGL